MTTPTPPTPHISDDDWREFQRIPEQGYSHRHWVNHKIATALAAVTAERDQARQMLADAEKKIASMELDESLREEDERFADPL